MSKTVLVIGDVMLDRYVDGTCDRISPEAPVPIINAREETYELGGAANVAANLQKLEIPTAIIGPIGTDIYGKKIQELINASGIRNYVLTNHVQTTVKTRITAKSQQLLRIDRESMYTYNVQMEEHITNFLEVESPELIVVSDYGKGFIDEGVMTLLRSYANNVKGCKILVDPKGLNWQKYIGAYLIKPNLKELSLVVGRELTHSDIDDDLMSYIYGTLNVENLLLTQSSNGMSLYSRKGLKHFPTRKVDVFDVTGAGDTAIAVIAYGLNIGLNLEESILLANKASSYVVTKNRTYAISKEELKNLANS